MQRSLIAQGIAFGELAGYAQRRIAGSSVIPGDLPARLLLVGLVLFVVSLIVFVALMGLLVLSVLSGRGAQTEPRLAPTHRAGPSAIGPLVLTFSGVTVVPPRGSVRSTSRRRRATTTRRAKSSTSSAWRAGERRTGSLTRSRWPPGSAC